MNRRKCLRAALVGVALAVAGGLSSANAHKSSTYTCPITGEQSPCENCCPLSNGPMTAAADIDAPKTDGDYICPLTGEKLGCPGCCPLNQSK